MTSLSHQCSARTQGALALRPACRGTVPRSLGGGTLPEPRPSRARWQGHDVLTGCSPTHIYPCLAR